MTRYYEPSNIESACQALASDEWGAKVISGGTALVLMMRQGLIAPDALVSIQRIPGLDGIRTGDSSVWIGARTTHSAVSSSSEIRAKLPSLAAACRCVGNIRVRNVGTMGGNLAEADYASDPPTVLAGLDAQCEIVGPDGQRRLSVRDLVTGFYTTSLRRGEIITSISVPVSPGRRYAYEKFVSRSSEDRPCVGVAAMADVSGREVTGLSVVVGAVAPLPQRFDELTATAIGQTLDPAICDRIAQAHAEAIDPIDDSRGSAWYRRRVTAVLVRRALERLAP